jgi:hypothetical protein
MHVIFWFTLGSVFHGDNGQNRFFDKSLSIVVTANGNLGVNGEHSPCDALVPAFLVDYAAQMYSFKLKQGRKRCC